MSPSFLIKPRPSLMSNCIILLQVQICSGPVGALAGTPKTAGGVIGSRRVISARESSLCLERSSSWVVSTRSPKRGHCLGLLNTTRTAEFVSGNKFLFDVEAISQSRPQLPAKLSSLGVLAGVRRFPGYEIDFAPGWGVVRLGSEERA